MTTDIQGKKILVLASTFPRWDGDFEPRFVEYLCQELAHFHSVTVLAPHFKGAKRYEKLSIGDRVIDVFRFRYFVPSLQTLAYEGGILANIQSNVLNLLLVPFFLTAQLFSIARLHKTFAFDVIHAHWIIPQGFVASIFATLWRNAPPILVTAHGGDLFALRGTLLTAVKRWVLGKAKNVTVVSKVMKTVCVELGISADKILVRSMGVDLVNSFTSTVAWSRRANLIFVGRLVEKKGVTHLLQAMEILRSKQPKLTLTIVGDGPERQELEEEVRKRRLSDRVTFVGHKRNDELPDLLRVARIAVMPSIVARSGDQEGLGLVAIEAMGCGCAVVTTDLPAIRDSVRDGETGLVAIAGDAYDLAEKIETLLQDESLIKGIAETGQQFAVQNFDWKVVGRCYAKLISNM